jgi:hypothetical protein
MKTPMYFVRRRTILHLCPLLVMLPVIFLLSPVASRSQLIVHGRVIDELTREPLESAVVTARGTKDGSGGFLNSTLTDRQGNFRLMVGSASDSLVISFVGYRAVCVCAEGCCHDGSCCKNGVCQMNKEFAMVRQDLDLTAVTIVPFPRASFHTIGQVDLRLRPVNSAQDLMRLVPGLFLGQHQGGGLAEHIFYRGFDADHGTDVNVSVDGMPVNLVSHIHGQGFADLHFLIPELVSKLDYGKGPYYSEYGDFTTAGYVAFRTYDVLDRNEVKIEAGQFRTGRVMAKVNLFGEKFLEKGESAYIAGEAAYTDGPFVWAQHLGRVNLYGKYNVNLSAGTHLTASFSTFSSDWRSSGEIPQRAVDEGLISRWGYIDSAQGGNTSRTSVILKLSSKLGRDWALENQAYYSHYDFALHYNPTFFADDSVNGDQLRQLERRDLAGYNGRISRHAYFTNGADLLMAAGIGAQFNQIGVSELSHTVHENEVLEQLQAGVPGESSVNAYVDGNYHLGRWVLNGGARVDRLGFQYRDFLNPSEPGRTKTVISPKLNISYTYSGSLQFFLKMGKGFHSNDARAVVVNRGLDVLPSAYGVDLGINWKPLPGMILQATAWTLYLQQEFVYDADEGTMEPGGKTRRQGIDVSARYQLRPWLFANLDLNVCHARNLETTKGENYLPLAVPFSSSGGLDFTCRNGVNGGISYRYMSKRPANEDYSLTAQGYFIADLTANYTQKKWEAGVEIQNLFNTSWRETQFETLSRMRHEPAAVDDISFTPGTPFFAKLKFAIFF